MVTTKLKTKKINSNEKGAYKERAMELKKNCKHNKMIDIKFSIMIHDLKNLINNDVQEVMAWLQFSSSDSPNRIHVTKDAVTNRQPNRGRREIKKAVNPL